MATFILAETKYSWNWKYFYKTSMDLYASVVKLLIALPSWYRSCIPHGDACTEINCSGPLPSPLNAQGDLFVPRTKTKMTGPRSFATSGPPSGTNCLTIWGTLPWVYLFSNKDWNRICLNNVDVRYSLNWLLPPHVSQLMHLHSSVRSITSKEVAFTLYYL